DRGHGGACARRDIVHQPLARRRGDLGHDVLPAGASGAPRALRRRGWGRLGVWGRGERPGVAGSNETPEKSAPTPLLPRSVPPTRPATVRIVASAAAMC